SVADLQHQLVNSDSVLAAPKIIDKMAPDDVVSDTMTHVEVASNVAVPEVADMPVAEATNMVEQASEPVILAAQDILVGANTDQSEDASYLLVGIADVAVGQRHITGNLDLATSGAARYRESVWQDGKVQLYFKGMIKGQYLLTASLDTEREREDLFGYLDANASYPVYGDASSVSDLAVASDGPLYLLLEKDASWAKWGRIDPGLRTHLASFRRSMQGAQGHYESLASDAHGQPQTQVDVFDARVYQKAAHVEYASPTGSLFYLKHNDVVAASVKIKLQTRDRISGNVLATEELEAELDYELNAAAGRIILHEPLSGQAPGELLIADQGNNASDPVYLLVDYSYVVIDKWDKGVTGGLVRQAINDRLRVGLVSVKEDQTNAVYQLDGVDASVYLDKEGQHQLDLGYAQSASRVAPRYISTDGGLSWGIAETPVSSVDADTEGKALSVRGQFQSLDERVRVGYYYRQLDAGFSAEASTHQQGWQAVGQNVSVQVNEQLDLRLKYDHLWRHGAGNAQANNEVGAQSTRVTSVQVNTQVSERLSVSAEMRHQRATQADSNNQASTNTDTDTMALQGRYQVSDHTEVALKQQATLKGQKNSHTAIDVRHRASANLTINTGASHGSQGSTGYADANYRVGDKVSLQTGLKYGTDHRLSSNAGMSYTPQAGQSYRVAVTDERGGGADNSQSLTLGAGRTVSADTKVDVSTSLTLADDSRRHGQSGTLTHQLDTERSLRVGVESYDQVSDREKSSGYGLNLGMDLSRQWALDVKAGQGYVHRLDGGRDQRQNAGLGASYVAHDGAARLRGLVRYEWAQDRGQNNRDRHLVQTGLSGKYNEDVTLFTDLDWGYTKARDTGVIEARNNQFNLGFAYRPVRHDRLNLLGKYSWIDEQKPAGQSSQRGLEALKGHVLSTDMLYDLTSHWSVGGRFAIRQADEALVGLPMAASTTRLMALNTRYYFMPETWLNAEYRLLDSSLTKDQKDGLVLELGRRFNNNIEAALGHNWAGYSADLVQLDYDVEGIYLRLSFIME
ncbi:MAG: hypothetical protein QGG88_08955, partial [Gammaproteobacteria bacterium]|nr:hypothetical protein [Gammaproteobacteria bacterium]